MNYPIDYKTDALYITKFEKDAKNSMVYQFIGAFPIGIAASPISYDNSDTLKCTVSFSYMRYLRRRSGTSLNKKGFIYRYLTGEKSWDYKVRNWNWVSGIAPSKEDVKYEDETEKPKEGEKIVNVEPSWSHLDHLLGLPS